MKTLCSSLLFFMILIALPSLALLIGNRTNGQAAETGQTLPTTETRDTHLGPENDNPPDPSIDVRELKTQMMGIAEKLMAQEGGGGRKHLQDLGFPFGPNINASEIKSLLKSITLDEDFFPIFEVSLDKLRAFAPSTNIENLLLHTGQLLYPIKVGERLEVKSSMTLRCIRDRQTGVEQKKEETCWRFTRVGLPKLISRLTDARHNLATKRPGLDLKSVRLVSIPALNRNFLGYKENTVIRLIPLVNDYIFTAGESYSAHDVFKWLSAEAKNMDESPR